MATPNEKLAASLNVLKNIQDRSIFAIEVSAHPELTRTHRERLVRAGFLRHVIGGWYLSSNPTEDAGDSTTWYAHMESFVAAYANARFGAQWCPSGKNRHTAAPSPLLSPEGKGSKTGLVLRRPFAFCCAVAARH